MLATGRSGSVYQIQILDNGWLGWGRVRRKLREWKGKEESVRVMRGLGEVVRLDGDAVGCKRKQE